MSSPRLLSGVLLLTLLTFAGSVPTRADEAVLRNPALNPLTLQTPPDHAPLMLVADGKPRFAIVIAAEAEKAVRHRGGRSIGPAVELLQEAFQQCIGITPPVLDAAATDELARWPLLLLLGDSPLTRAQGIRPEELPPEGFVLKTFPGGLCLVGHDSSLDPAFNRDPLDRLGPRRGTLHGAYDFIERYLGCRFFFPGEFGSLWPPFRELTVTPAHYTDYPRFANRSPSWIIWTLMGEENRQKWAPLLGEYSWPPTLPFQERWRLAEPEPFWAGHNPEPRALHKAYPEQQATIFYRSPNGNLYFNEKQHIGNYFDVTNLKFADLLVESLHKYYDSQGKVNDGWTMLSNSFIPFGQCDSGVPLPDMLTHPTVRELDLITPACLAGKSPYSNLYGRFYNYFGNRLKQEFPGKKLLLLPYSNYTEVPSDPRWTLPDNIEVRVCIGDFPARTRQPEAAARWRQACQAWSEALGNRPVASLWLYNVPGNPFARAIAPMFVGEVPKLLGPYLGRQSLFLDQYGGLEWYYYAANYAAARSMWNPDFQVEAAIAEHWVPFYGPAAGPHLQEFHRLLYEAYCTHFVPSDERNPLYPPAVIDQLEECLKQAAAKLPPDSPEKRRFLVFAHPWAEAFESQRNRQAYQRPVDTVTRLPDGVMPVIDGKLDEPFWQQCRPVGMRDPRGSNRTPDKTVEFRLAWDDTGLYGAYRTVPPYSADANKSLWNNCHVEIFLAPGLEREYMCHYALDARAARHTGHKQFAPVDQPYNSYWQSPGFRAASHVSAEGWSAEFHIPFADLKTAVPKPYACWYANLVSTGSASPGHFLGNSMTLGNNHNFEQYGMLKFLGKGD